MVKLKGLPVLFLAASAETYSRIACDEARVAIRCPAGSKIKIKTAFYGRHDANKCSGTGSNIRKKSRNTNCSIPQHVTARIIGDACDNESSCEFDLSMKLMQSITDPCPDTSKYLEYSYECVQEGFECPGAVMGAVFTKDHFTSYRNDGGWATDASDDGSRVYYMPWDQSGAAEVKEFRNMEDLQHSQQFTYYRLNDKADGTGFVVRDRKLYYNKRQSRELVKFDLEGRYQELSVVLPDANYYDTSPYSIEKNTDIDLAVDENGLWAIYATEKNQGRIVISKLDPNTLKVESTFETGIEKTAVMEGWMTCGVFYGVQADSENLLFIYDTNKGKEITGSVATRIEIPDLPESTTSIKYDPKTRSLQVWSLGQMISYQLRFHRYPEDLYPTTTKRTTTTSTTRPSTSTTTTRVYATLKCPTTSFLGFEFPEAKFNQVAEIPCPDTNHVMRHKCGGNPKNPEWQQEPDTSGCVSDWIKDTHDNFERLASSEGLEQSRRLLTKVTRERDNLRKFDYLAVLNLVMIIHDQNPKLIEKELQQNLIKVIDNLFASERGSAWESMNSTMKNKIRSRETKIVQQLLSRLSCKLRMDSHTFQFSDSDNMNIYLEPAGTVNSALPVEIEFPDDTSNSPYRSLIKINRDDGEEYLGSLHTDCERPVSAYGIEYTFDSVSATCSGTDAKCHPVTVENKTKCICPANAGFVRFNSESDPSLTVTLAQQQDADTKQAVILAVFIFSALLHAASFIASLLLVDSNKFVHHEGLNRGLRQTHRAINFCILLTLITLATADMIFTNQMFCSVVSCVLHLLCVSSFVWATIRPLYLAMFCVSQDRKLIGGCWLTSLVAILGILITAASATISMFSSQRDLCMTNPSVGFTWSAAVIAIVLGALSMLLVSFAAIKLRENEFESFETQRVRSALLWTGTFTVLLCCQWALIFLWLGQSEIEENQNNGSYFGILLAVVSLIHASLSFINGCICNSKAQSGWRSALSRFGFRSQEEKSEFYWTRAPDGRDEFTIRPNQVPPMTHPHPGQKTMNHSQMTQPDCVQMTYGHPYEPSTMQINQSQYSGQLSNQSAGFQPMTHYCTGFPYSNMTPGAIYNPNHHVTMGSRDTQNSNYADFRPAGSEFEYSRGSNQSASGTVSTNQNVPAQMTHQMTHQQRQPFLPNQNYDAEV